MAILSFLAVALFALRVQTLVIPDFEQLALRLVEENADQASQENADCSSMIAIVGSGISGAIAAFRISEGYRRQALPDQRPCITVFEKNPVVGGRVTEAYVYDDPFRPVDTCAATFSALDTCLASAVGDVGLEVFPDDVLRRPQSGTGVWDGSDIQGFVDPEGFRGPLLWSYYKALKQYPRYKDVPLKFEDNATIARLKFDELLPKPLEFGLSPVPPRPTLGKRNLREELERTQLDKLVQNPLCLSKEDFELDQSAEGDRFLREAIIPGARERFFANPSDLNALELYFGFEDAIPSYIAEGNLRLVERLLKLSGASVLVDTEVVRIEQSEGLLGQPISLLTHVPNAIGMPRYGQFDTVILATSLDRTDIAFQPALPDLPGLQQDYEDSVVTHFTTLSRLDPSFFNWENPLPQNIFTTEKCETGFCTLPPFLSLTHLREELAPGYEYNPPIEHLYKLVSRVQISNETISQYLLPLEDFPYTPKISWIHREVLPKSVPIVKADRDRPCRTLLEDFEILPNVYYAGGAEQVVASAEFACRFGENVANLIVNGYEE